MDSHISGLLIPSAILLLASRLETDTGLDYNSDGAASEANQFFLEEVAQGHASPALMMRNAKTDRRSKLVGTIERLKSGYQQRLDKFNGLISQKGIGDSALDRIVGEAVDNLDKVVSLYWTASSKFIHSCRICRCY